MVEGEC